MQLLRAVGAGGKRHVTHSKALLFTTCLTSRHLPPIDGFVAHSRERLRARIYVSIMRWHRLWPLQLVRLLSTPWDVGQSMVLPGRVDHRALLLQASEIARAKARYNIDR